MEKIELKSGITAIHVDHHGRTVYSDAYIPEAKGFPLVIFSHGYNGCKDDFREAAEYLMNNGTASITFTFCGSGERDPSGFGTTNMTLFTEKEDLSALIDYAKQIKGFNGSLYLFGGSQGGMVSAMAAEERALDIKGMVLLFPAFCIPDDWNNIHYPIDRYPTPESIPESIDFWGVKLGRNFVLTMRELDIYASMEDFRSPVLIMHGTNDAIVPISYSQRAAKTYPNAELVTYGGEGHGFTPSTMRDVETKLLAFVNGNRGIFF
ncbi:MAG: alpha/beta fold hydrolase [Oscillospiraceae bacterium]|nr:alpha/beta fold hydrolase [Oscillospiraceae bacterium]